MTSVSDNLIEIQNIKSALKAVINGSGSTVGELVADYPGAVDGFHSKIATAITTKGAATSATDTPDQMASNILNIPSGSQTAKVNFTSYNPNTYYVSKGEVKHRTDSFYGEDIIDV